MDLYLGSVGGDNPCTFLASVLESIEAKVGQFGRIFVIENTTHSAFMGGASLRRLQTVIIIYHRRYFPWCFSN